MWKTVLFLLFTLIIVPLVTFQFDEALSDLQYATLMELVAIYLIAAGLCFVVSTISKNYSQVDKLWSVIPIVYVWVTAWRGGFEDRLLLMAVLVTIWGVRLTLNFARRGGYKWKFWEGDEDYRWAILRAKPEFQAPWRWIAFNLFFISLYQMGLILLFTLPILKSMEGGPLGWPDLVLALIFVGFVMVETIADQQQWNFQQKKQLQIAGGNKPTKGFLDEGLWGIVRHPNYAAEQAIWVVFYLFSIASTGLWINWSIAGCLLLILLFKGSSDFSEGISVGKYADYEDYQKRVPRFIPLPKGKKEPETVSE
jgi:steroid 5-alpha reductase family enzyme